MDDDECIHGLGMIAACVICNGRQARERHHDDRDYLSPVDHETRIFIAQYDGFCGVCHERVYAGTEIAWQPHRKPAHVECWEERE